MIELNRIYNEDCMQGIKRIPDASIDCILTDPPYLYLKKQKLDRPFDEQFLFSEFKRVLKPAGFVVLFGRGTSFYRWNTILAELGFKFKEEIVWDKAYTSSPLMPISRVHETIVIYTKKAGVINKVKVPYLEMKKHNIDSICQDIKRMRSMLNNTESLNAVLSFLEDNKLDYDLATTDGFAASYNRGSFKGSNRTSAVMQCILNGMNEKTIIRSDFKETKRSGEGIVRRDASTGDRCTNVMQSVSYGMNEKSIIKQGRDHYKTIHPTQKPVRLLERLLALTTQPGSIVLDPFSGSCSTAIACINTGRKYIGFEIDKEYYEAGIKRINNYQPKLAI